MLYFDNIIKSAFFTVFLNEIYFSTVLLHGHRKMNTRPSYFISVNKINVCIGSVNEHNNVKYK